jgi:recombinational DNA repair protein (RecF pathway)
MRHKYSTAALVLARSPLSEASSLVTLLTSEVGLVRARAQGIRKPGAKMASALQTLSEADVMLLRGKEGWRLVGALRVKDWFGVLMRPARMRAGRMSSLLLRLLSGEAADPELYTIVMEFLDALAVPREEGISLEEYERLQDAIECLAALRILHALGVDAGEMPDALDAPYDRAVLLAIAENREAYIVRINRGIAASGL